MGILNVTEDSFYDGGSYTDEVSVLRRAEQILSEGGGIIDVGAVSTRPGAEEVPAEEEWKRLEKPLQLIAREFPEAIVSVDTWRADIAERSIDAGAAIINDISGGIFEPRIIDVVGEKHVPYVLMHTTAKPETMQQTFLTENLLASMLQFFGMQIQKLKIAGCHDIIIDPGFGFGKTLEQNYFLMNQLQAFQILDCPILAGISRKSMIYKLLDTTPEHSLTGTTALNMIALQKGASILRVHDVKEAVEVVKINCKLESCDSDKY